MKLTTKQNITTAAQEFLTLHKMTYADLSKRCNVRSEYLTLIFRENSDFTIPSGGSKPTLVADKYFRRIANFIGYSLVKTFWDIKATPQLTATLAVLEDSKKHGTTSVVIGETGAGKTNALRLFQKQNPMDTLIVTVGSNDNISDLIQRILDVLNITGGKTKSRKLRNIYYHLRELKDQGYHPQLIFDEAEYMKQPALCSIKEIYDHANEWASIVLVGTHQLLENIDQMRKKNKPGIPQFYRRIKFGIRKLPKVDRSYKLFVDGLSPEVVKYLRVICDNYGELHDVLVPVRREAERTGNLITVEFIQKVLNLKAE